MGINGQRKNYIRHHGFALLVLLGGALIWPGIVAGQERAEERFQPALPGRAFVFPEDHRAHPNYKTEWWYYNGQLADAEGRRYGYQLTFFRVGIRPGPVSSQGSRWRVRDSLPGPFSRHRCRSPEIFLCGKSQSGEFRFGRSGKRTLSGLDRGLERGPRGGGSGFKRR